MRWTIERLEEIDNLSFAEEIMRERRRKLSYYSPLSMKLKEAIIEIENIRYERAEEEARKRKEE